MANRRNDNPQYMFRLYVNGSLNTVAQHASAVRTLCDELFTKAEWSLDVIDVIEHPALAEEDRILATPTLVRATPPPPRRVIGDLSNPQAVCAALNIDFPGQRKLEGGSP